jgi:hypothetical protein
MILKNEISYQQALHPPTRKKQTEIAISYLDGCIYKNYQKCTVMDTDV